MRILQVSNGFPPEAFAGVELHTLQVCQALRDRHTVAVFCRMGNPDCPEYVLQADSYEGVPVWRVNNNFLDVTGYAQYYRQPEIEAHFHTLLEAWRPDIIHFQHCLGLSAALPAIAAEHGIPSLMTLHDYWYICPTVDLLNARLEFCPGTHHAPNCFECLRFVSPRLAYWRRTRFYRVVRRRVPEFVKRLVDKVWLARAARPKALTPTSGQPAASITSLQQQAIASRVSFMRETLRYPVRLTTPSVSVKEIYQEFGIPAEAILVAPLGMEIGGWREAGAKRSRPSSPDHLRFAYIGWLLPHKGVDVLLRAFQHLPGDGHQLKLYGFQSVDAQFARKLNQLIAADPRITVHGSYPHAELPHILDQMDVFLMPTLCHETFSFIVREALLAGVWVVASDLGVMRELIHPGQNGALAAPGNVEAWAHALQATVCQWPPANDLPALTFVPQTFNGYASQMEALYEAALDGSSKAAS